MRFPLIPGAALAAPVLALALISAAGADERVDALMMRYPDVSATQIAFEYGNDLWVAPRTGGTAIPLSSPSGREVFPRFSPDGATIAFSANYDGSFDVYTLPVTGGIPKRMTCEPGWELVQDWSPDGRVVYASDAETVHWGLNRLYYAAPEGGIPTPLPLHFADSPSFSADGRLIAFTPWNAENRTWNRYQGGLAPDIWLYDQQAKTSRQLTDFAGTDACPMFFGNSVYYISDAGPEHRRNIWMVDITSGQHTQITHFDKFETKYPSSGPDCIVLENGGKLYLLSVPGHALSEVKILLPGDRKSLRTQLVNVAGQAGEYAISPGGKRLAVTARGDVWTLPAKNGYPRNLDRSNSSAERSPAWSPDGKHIAYLSDASGEYQIYVRPADGTGDARQLTREFKVWLDTPVWSPDSKWLAISDKSSNRYLVNVESGAVRQFDTDPWAGWTGFSWSPDSNWIAYSASDNGTGNSYVKLYNVKEAKATAVTTPMFSCGNPVFDLSGDYIYYISSSNFNSPRWGETDGTGWQFQDVSYPVLLPLRSDLPSPFAAENDEEPGQADAEAADGKDAKPQDAGAEPATAGKDDSASGESSGGAETAKDGAKDAKQPEVKETKIDLDGIESRGVALPLPPGGYWGLGAGNHAVFYLHGGALQRFGLDDKKESPVFPGAYGYELTPDASQALVLANGAAYIVPAMPGAPPPSAPVSTAGMQAEINPRAEWRQMINDVYKLYRDFFYDPGMHKVNWAAVRDRSLKMVDEAATRDDVTYIISEMVSELNCGHTYVGGGATEPTPNGNTGSLGCDFAVATDAAGTSGVQITKVYSGAPWEVDMRGPLGEPGVNVKAGEFLLAVNGVSVNPARSPYELLQGAAGAVVKLTVGPNATKDDKARDVLVKPVGDDRELRLRSWIETNRQYVEKASGGKAGYVYVRDTGFGGLVDLQRQFTGQYSKEALVIDERWNGGGMIPDRFIEILNRPLLSKWAVRDGNDWSNPNFAHQGPKVMLINEHAGSGGDCFPYYFRETGLGKLVGTRTWGGLVGITGSPALVDGSGVTVPCFGIYELDGTWAIEGHGVDPDYVVVNDPASLAAGKDLQLDKAISVVMDELRTKPGPQVKRPAFPDRSGAGIPEDER